MGILENTWIVWSNANVFSYTAILPFGTLIKFVVWFPICPPFWLRVRTIFLPETTSHYSSWLKPAWMDFWDVGNNLCCLDGNVPAEQKLDGLEKVWLDFHPFASHPFSSVSWFHLIITTVVPSKMCLYLNLIVSGVRSENSFISAPFLEGSDNCLPPAVGGIISEQFHASFQVIVTKCLFCYFIWRTHWYVLLLLHRISCFALLAHGEANNYLPNMMPGSKNLFIDFVMQLCIKIVYLRCMKVTPQWQAEKKKDNNKATATGLSESSSSSFSTFMILLIILGSLFVIHFVRGRSWGTLALWFFSMFCHDTR